MPRQSKQQESWFAKAAELMVREGKNLRQAAADLDVLLTPEESDNIGRRKAFQKILTQERNRYHTEIGSDPSLTKAAAIGNLQLIATKLMQEGEYFKAGDIILKLAKIAGWVGSESNVNIFGGLTSQDFEQIRTKLKNDLAPGASTNPAPTLPN